MSETMRPVTATRGLMPALASLLLLGGCAVYDYGGYWYSGYPGYSTYYYGGGYGYRNPDGLVVVYDPGPRLYSVVSYPNLYWSGGYYYRRHGNGWERSRYHRGPWAFHRAGPPRVSAGSAPPPGRPIAPGPGVPGRPPPGGPGMGPPQGQPMGRPPVRAGGDPTVLGPGPQVRYAERDGDPRWRRIERTRVPTGVPPSTVPNREPQRNWPATPPQGWQGTPWPRGNPTTGPGPSARPVTPDQAPDRPQRGMPGPRPDRSRPAGNLPGMPGAAPVNPRSYPAEAQRTGRPPLPLTRGPASNRQEDTSGDDDRRGSQGRPPNASRGGGGPGAAPNWGANPWPTQPRGDQSGGDGGVRF